MSRWPVALGTLGLAVTLPFATCTQGKNGPADATVAPAKDAAAPAVAPTSVDPEISAVRRDAQRALELLSKWVQPGASDPTGPWAMAHGLLAFGPSLAVPNGKLVADYIVTEYSVDAELLGKKRVVFPSATFSDEPLEPHKNLIVKTLVELGLPLDRSFALKGNKKITLDELVGQVAPIIAVPTTDDEWRHLAWSLSMLLGSRSLDTVVGQDTGKPVSVRELAIASMSYLEEQQKFIEAAMLADQPEAVEKKKQGIFAHTCGGMHLIQAAVFGASKVGDPALIDRARHQLDILAFRYLAERPIYEAALKKAPREYLLILKIQELKFYGHWLETIALAVKWGVLPVTPELKETSAEVTRQLVITVVQLEQAYRDLDTIRTVQKQSYLDLIGDGCHAIRGLREALRLIFAAP
ncbi:MAG: hypothetical protein HY791_03900 [Deltaproteobacteria bacterium]|nr:hypothetical protein [Deltaproteobacteria bacterium]